MMKCAAIIFLLMFTSGKQIFAESIHWNNGVVVLKNSEVVQGEIALELNHQVIMLRIKDRIDVLPAHKIKSVNFFDQANNINRKILSLKNDNGWKGTWSLYEVVLQGDFQLLRKPKHTAGKSPSDADDFHYFICHREKMVALRKFRSEVYPKLLTLKSGALKSYVAAQRLNPNNASHAVLIIDYYNQLSNDGWIVASH